MTALYVPPTDEADHKKQNQSLQLIGGVTSTNTTNIATNTTNIATNTASIATLTASDATQVVGPGSATDNGFAVYNGTTGKLVKDHAATIALASEVSGTLPVANGGTNYTGIAWSTFAPAVTASGGTFTTVAGAGSFLAIGKAVWFTVTVTITTVGSATGAIIVALPTGTAKRDFAGAAREIAVSGVAGVASIATSATTLRIVKYDSTTLAASGNQIFVSGFYETT